MVKFMQTQLSEALRSLYFSARWFICSTHRSASPCTPPWLLPPSLTAFFLHVVLIRLLLQYDRGFWKAGWAVSSATKWMYSPDERRGKAKRSNRATHWRRGDDEAREAGCFWTVWGYWKQRRLIQYEEHNLFYRTLAPWKETRECAKDRSCQGSCEELQDEGRRFSQ